MVTVLKLDVDIKMDEALLETYVMSRLRMVEDLGYTITHHTFRKTEHGYHFWIHLVQELGDEEACRLQFLVGDDHKRCKFNFLRNEAKVFHEFNALFSKKLPKRKRGGENIGEKI